MAIDIAGRERGDHSCLWGWLPSAPSSLSLSGHLLSTYCEPSTRLIDEPRLLVLEMPWHLPVLRLLVIRNGSSARFTSCDSV